MPEAATQSKEKQSLVMNMKKVAHRDTADKGHDPATVTEIPHVSV